MIIKHLCFLDESNENSPFFLFDFVYILFSLLKDLENSNVLNVCLGLTAASKLVYDNNIMQSVLQDVQKLTKDKRYTVKVNYM